MLTQPVIHNMPEPVPAFWFLSVCLTLLITLSSSGQDLNGQQILDRSIAVYRSATSYQDTGRVIMDYYKLGDSTVPEFATAVAFQTAYDRLTHQFQFHYKKEPAPFDELFIWTEGSKVFSWWKITKGAMIRSSLAESLTLLLSGATGISGTSSRKIPGLLLTQPIETGWGIDSLKNVKIIGNAVEDGHPCYRLSGISWKDHKAFLWIDKQSFLIRRIDEYYLIQKQTVQEQTMHEQTVHVRLIYQSTLNKSIPSLRFAPPDTSAYSLNEAPH